MKYFLITNDPKIAEASQDAGVDRVFIDLEVLGKHSRQGHKDTVISRHSMEDVARVRGVLTKTELLVRVNPVHHATRREVQQVVDQGADVVMLPYFKTLQEVDTFVSAIAGRATASLLVETREAIGILPDILAQFPIDEVHLGLNDLHLSYGLTFLFEPLVNGIVDGATSILRRVKLPFGIGGVGRPGTGKIPAESILQEYLRQGASRTILSRTFFQHSEVVDWDVDELIMKRVSELRAIEHRLRDTTEAAAQHNRYSLERAVAKIVAGM